MKAHQLPHRASSNGRLQGCSARSGEDSLLGTAAATFASSLSVAPTSLLPSSSASSISLSATSPLRVLSASCRKLWGVGEVGRSIASGRQYPDNSLQRLLAAAKARSKLDLASVRLLVPQSAVRHV